jgi:hypothetical protein
MRSVPPQFGDEPITGGPVSKNRLAFLAVAILAIPTIALAQVSHDRDLPQPTDGVRFGLGVGLTLPMGSYSNVNKLGFHGLGLIQLPIKHSPVHLRFDVMYSHTPGKTAGVSSINLLGEPSAAVRPYVLGGIGLYNSSASGGGGSSTNFAFGFGGGVLFGMGTSMHAFAEARYMSIQASGGSLSFIPITLGLMFSGN